MACSTATMVQESYEEPVLGSTSGAERSNDEQLRRRRHSSYHVRRWSIEHTDNIQLLVCISTISHLPEFELTDTYRLIDSSPNSADGSIS